MELLCSSRPYKNGKSYEYSFASKHCNDWICAIVDYCYRLTPTIKIRDDLKTFVVCYSYIYYRNFNNTINWIFSAVECKI